MATTARVTPMSERTVATTCAAEGCDTGLIITENVHVSDPVDPGSVDCGGRCK